MKKSAIVLGALLAATAAHADVFKAPDGHYVGHGTWTDSQGRRGTVSSVLDLENLNWVETTTYSDGRVIETAVTFDEQGGSTYNITVSIGGQTYTIGYGACSQSTCASSANTPDFKFVEVTDYNRVGMARHGALTDATNVWTFYTLGQYRRR